MWNVWLQLPLLALRSIARCLGAGCHPAPLLPGTRRKTIILKQLFLLFFTCLKVKLLFLLLSSPGVEAVSSSQSFSSKSRPLISLILELKSFDLGVLIAALLCLSLSLWVVLEQECTLFPFQPEIFLFFCLSSYVWQIFRTRSAPARPPSSRSPSPPVTLSAALQEVSPGV